MTVPASSRRIVVTRYNGRSNVSAVARAPVTPGSDISMVTGTSVADATIAASGRPDSASMVAPDFPTASNDCPSDKVTTAPGSVAAAIFDRINAAPADVFAVARNATRANALT